MSDDPRFAGNKSRNRERKMSFSLFFLSYRGYEENEGSV